MADDVAKLRSIRTAFKGHCTRNINDATEIMNSDTPDTVRLEVLLEAVSTRFEKITTVNQKILDNWCR